MKKLKQIAAFVVAGVMAASLTACNQVGGWIMKAEDESLEIPVGVYINNLYNEYWTARYSVSDTSSSPLGQTIEEKNGEQWIKDAALEDTEKIFAVLNMCREKEISLTEEEITSVQSSTNSTWDNYGENYEKMGVSKDSIQFLGEYNKLSDKLFQSIYGAGGSSAVTDAEAKEYFEENFVSFKYISVPLTNDSGTEFSQEDKDKVKVNLQEYLDSYLGGKKTFNEIVADYNAEHSNATVKGQELITDLTTNTSIADEIKDAVKETEAGNGTIVTYNKTMYLILKYDITKESSYLKDNKSTVLYAMRGEEFTNTVEEAVKAVKYALNDRAIDKYSPSWIESLGF